MPALPQGLNLEALTQSRNCAFMAFLSAYPEITYIDSLQRRHPFPPFVSSSRLAEIPRREQTELAILLNSFHAVVIVPENCSSCNLVNERRNAHWIGDLAKAS